MKINPKESLTVTFSIDPSAMSSLPRIVFCFVLFFFLKSFFSLFGPPPFFLFLLFSRLLVQWTQWRDLKITKRPVKRSSWWENKKTNKKKPNKKVAVPQLSTAICRCCSFFLPSFAEFYRVFVNAKFSCKKISSVLLLIYFFLPARLLSVFEWFGIDFSPVFTQMFSVHRPDFEQTIILTPPSNGSEQHIKKQ